jgi:hypothetical protein
MKFTSTAALAFAVLVATSASPMAQTGGPGSTGVGSRDSGAGSGKAAPATGQASRAQTPGEQSARAVQKAKKKKTK